MAYSVNNIQLTARDSVNFYLSTGEIIRNMSQVMPSTSTYILRNGLDIIIFQPAGSVDIPLLSGVSSGYPFIFSALTVETIGARIYAAINPNDSDAAEQGEQRAIDVYNDIVTHIFKGCCPCGDGGACSVQYQYNGDLGAGTWWYASGLLIISNESYLGQDFTSLFSMLPSGSWISFYSDADPTIFGVFEVSNYSSSSGYATWSATLVDGSPSFTDETVFCVTIAPAGSGSGGTFIEEGHNITVTGSGTDLDPYIISATSQAQGWQQTLDVDPDLNKDNESNANGHNFSIVDFLNMWFFGTESFETNITNGSNETDRYHDDAGVTDSATDGTHTAQMRLFATGAEIAQTTGVNEVNYAAVSQTLRARTPGINAGTRTAGQIATLADAANGRWEWQNGGGSGVDSVTGDSVDNTDPANPVVNAIPYDAANQTQDITGEFEVDPGAGEVHIINSAATSKRGLEDGAVYDQIAGASLISEYSLAGSAIQHLIVDTGTNISGRTRVSWLAGVITSILEVFNSGSSEKSSVEVGLDSVVLHSYDTTSQGGLTITPTTALMTVDDFAGNEGIITCDDSNAQLEVDTDTGGIASVLAANISGTPTAQMTTDDGAGHTTGIVSEPNKVRLITPDVNALIDPTGKYVKGIASDGSVEFDTPSGLSWSVITADQSLVVNTGVIANKGSLCVLTLPVTAAAGTIIRVAGMNAGLWKIAQNASQKIRFGNVATTAGTGGSIASTLAYDAIEMVCSMADTEWIVLSSNGGAFTVT